MELKSYTSEEGEAFRKALPCVNFVTPHVLGYYSIKNGIAEIAEGILFNNSLYRITVVKNDKHIKTLSKCVNTLEEVEEYLKSFK